jgi:hypothetical protein
MFYPSKTEWFNQTSLATTDKQTPSNTVYTCDHPPNCLTEPETNSNLHMMKTGTLEQHHHIYQQRSALAQKTFRPMVVISHAAAS